MKRQSRWKLVRHALETQRHEVEEHAEEQDERIPTDSMRPDEACPGRRVPGAAGSVQHHPDIGAGKNDEEATEGRVQGRLQHEVTEGRRGEVKEAGAARMRARGPGPRASR